MTLGSLRDNISMGLQDTFLFNGTVQCGCRDAGKRDAIAAAKAANAPDLIVRMENGYGKGNDERGVRLWGG